MSGLFDDVATIPDCSDLIDTFGRKRGFNTPVKVANEMMREARLWQERHPNEDVCEVIPPNWKEYVQQNI
ncbi:MAG: hypothetical protein IKO85_05125 [Bacteroidaceae bacterium]|nr:hypothetical protein [Bacteroidaceae bacterium]